MFFCSVRTRANFSPARKVLSTTEPVESAFSFVRTNAPPLPGLTCWNSTIRHTWPSSSMCMPFLNWFVETVSATARNLAAVERPQIDKPSGDIPFELGIEDLVVGEGDEATAGKTVTVHYVGVAFRSGEEFDASWNRGQPF